jgi:hypothetical protein
VTSLQDVAFVPVTTHHHHHYVCKQIVLGARLLHQGSKFLEKTIVLEINYIMFRFSVPRWNVKQRRGFKDLPGIEIQASEHPTYPGNDTYKISLHHPSEHM